MPSSRFSLALPLLLLLLLVVGIVVNWAAPIGDQIAGPQTATSRPVLIQGNGANYLNSELEFEALLERLKKEAEESVIENPSNYVPDDMEMEELMRLIESSTEPVGTNPAAVAGTTSEPAGLANTEAATISSGEPSVALRVTSRVATTTATTTTAAAGVVATSTAESDDCAICLESIEKPGSYVAELDCRHRFHTDCLQQWISNCPYICQCPCCRRRLAHRSDYVSKRV